MAYQSFFGRLPVSVSKPSGEFIAASVGWDDNNTILIETLDFWPCLHVESWAYLTHRISQELILRPGQILEGVKFTWHPTRPNRDFTFRRLFIETITTGRMVLRPILTAEEETLSCIK